MMILEAAGGLQNELGILTAMTSFNHDHHGAAP